MTAGGTMDIPQITEPEFVNVYGAQESILTVRYDKQGYRMGLPDPYL